MSPFEYRMIAGGWFLLILFLTVFWYATFRRLAEVLKGRLKAAGSGRELSGIPGLFLYIFRADFKQSGDDHLIAVCRRLRQLLYGYLGGLGAYIVFLVIMRPHY